MGVYLVDHPPRIQQFRCPRKVKPSGVFGVHTAESFPDETGRDDGTINVANFIVRRTNYGSYHWLADSDSILQLVELNCVAYHIGTYGLNEHTIGISAATQAAKWDSLSKAWVDGCVKNMARCAAISAKWLKAQYGITVPARRLTLTQARNKVPGFIAHGDADPDRRTDPGKLFPWTLFFKYYTEFMIGDIMARLDDEDRTWLKAMVRSEIRGEFERIVTRTASNVTTKVRANDGGRYAFFASQNAGRALANTEAIIKAIDALPDVDSAKLAADVAAAVARLDAEAVAEQLEVTVKTEKDTGNA